MPKNMSASTAGNLKPRGTNLQYSMKKKMNSMLMIGKYLINGLVLMKISAAN